MDSLLIICLSGGLLSVFMLHGSADFIFCGDPSRCDVGFLEFPWVLGTLGRLLESLGCVRRALEFANCSDVVRWRARDCCSGIVGSLRFALGHERIFDSCQRSFSRRQRVFDVNQYFLTYDQNVCRRPDARVVCNVVVFSSLGGVWSNGGEYEKG